jgi:hypothetical protein
MKKVEAIIKPFKLDEVKEALQAAGLQGFLYFVELERLDDRLNFFHSPFPASLVPLAP